MDGATRKGAPAEGLPAIVNLDFRPGPATVFRTLGAVDDEFVVQGKLIDPDGNRIHGSYGCLAQPTVYGRQTSVQQVRQQILDRALPHHYTAARGHLFK